MSNAPLTLIKQQFFNLAGQFLAGGLLYSYEAGTSTPQATYNATGSTNTNPVTLDAFGRADVWLPFNEAFKFNLTDQYGNQLPGWPIDNIVNSALLDLYGGVDTGSANAYILTFTTPAASYAAMTGTPIYWIPANSNTGASTLDVNGLGAISILNPNGSALSQGQIVAGQMAQVIYYNGDFLLTSIGAGQGVAVGTFGPQVAIASGFTCDLGSTGSHTISVTGSNQINSFGSSASIEAPIYIMTFAAGGFTITNSASLICPGGGSIAVAAGDAAIAEYLGSGNWQILFYQSAVSYTLLAVKSSATSRASTTSLTADPALTFALSIAGTYSVEAWINDLSGTSSGGLSGTFGYTGTLVDGYWGMTGTGTDVTTVPLTAFGTGAELESTQTGNASLWFAGYAVVSTTGTLSFNWAQHSSNATASLVGLGSWMRVTKISASTGGFLPVTHLYNVAGSGTETIPTGATTMTIEVFGPGGGSGYDYLVPPPPYYSGGGGGSGGYAKSSYTVSGDGGESVNYTVGTGGIVGSAGSNSSVSSNSYTVTTMTCTSGGGGTNATSSANGTGGGGGTATGGTVSNTSGNQGGPQGSGAGLTGAYASGNAGAPPPSQAGGAGVIAFHYT